LRKLGIVVHENIRWCERNIELILTASFTWMSRFPEFKLPVLSQTSCRLQKKKYKQGLYQFGRLLKIILCDLRKARTIGIHKIKHGFGQSFQMGRKCQKWIWDAGFSETSADPPRRPGMHYFVFVGTFIAMRWISNLLEHQVLV